LYLSNLQLCYRKDKPECVELSATAVLTWPIPVIYEDKRRETTGLFLRL
jgi:hypothetical protein